MANAQTPGAGESSLPSQAPCVSLVHVVKGLAHPQASRILDRNSRLMEQAAQIALSRCVLCACPILTPGRIHCITCVQMDRILWESLYFRQLEAADRPGEGC